MGGAEDAAFVVDTLLHAISTFRNHCMEQFGDCRLTLGTCLSCMTRMPVHISLACLPFRMDCHGLPRDVAAWAGIPRLQRFCSTCQYRTIGDEKHLVFECPALQDLRDKRPHLFEGTQADAMVLFMWHDDILGVVRFIDACLERILYTSDQP